MKMKALLIIYSFLKRLLMFENLIFITIIAQAIRHRSGLDIKDFSAVSNIFRLRWNPYIVEQH